MISVNVVNIPPEGVDLVGEEPSSMLNLKEESCLQPKGVVSYKLHVTEASDLMIVTGSIMGEIAFKCVKCAKDSTMEVLEGSFSYTYDLEKEDVSDDGYVDLTPRVREAIILAFPSYPVCRNDCKGLCPQCGCDLNLEQCDCVEPVDNRWGGLDGLEL